MKRGTVSINIYLANLRNSLPICMYAPLIEPSLHAADVLVDV
jgi:hypothetical protein